MKKVFTLIALGSASLLSADQYGQSYGGNGGYYQEEQNGGNYYQQYPQQNSQGYNQRNNQYDYQQGQRNQAYDQNQQYYQQQGNQAHYYQQQGNQGYDRNQRNDNSYGSQNSNNQKPVSDQDINKKIHDAIGSGWFSKGFQNVTYDVNNGYVTLRGTVDTLENKNKVEESVKKIDGVRQVNNQITIAKENPNANAYSDSQLQDSEKKYPQDAAASPQDRQLNAKIRDKLGAGWFSSGYQALVIRTANGIVIISGSVDKPEDVQKINDQVRNIEGVRQVNNQLSVKNR
jgi:osmotically-inducible protein OsmY